MLIGSYLGVLGEKRRVAVPKRFLEEFGEKLVIAKWYEDCLLLVSMDFWGMLLGRLTGGSKVVSLGVRDIERFILGSAFEVIADGQGRIIIPEILAEFANLNKELVFLGLGDRAEIWAKEAWGKRARIVAASTRDFIEDLAKK